MELGLTVSYINPILISILNMFYQSKRLFTFFHKNSFVTKEAEKKLPLGFEIFDIDGVPAKEIGPFHQIIKAGDLNYLVVGKGKALNAYDKSLVAETKAKVADWIINSGVRIDVSELEKVKAFARNMLNDRTDQETAEFFAYLIAHDTVGYGPISVLFDASSELEEIEINSPTQPIRVYSSEFGDCQTNLRFTSEQAFRLGLNKLIYKAEKELSSYNSIVDAQVENARIHAQIRPYAQSGGLATIRLRKKRIMSMPELMQKGTADAETLAYAWLAVECGMNVIVSGAPASGKTTLLNTLLYFVPAYHRTVIIEEDVNEIDASNSLNNIVALYGTKYGGVSIREQAINALRLRPDRLVIGELRGEEARDVFASANLGIPFMATMHSNEGAYSILKKLVTRPMEVDVKALSMLDVAFYMKQSGITDRRLYSGYEFKWLSRGETTLGIEIASSDKVDVSEVIKFGRLNEDYIEQSKVIAAYAKKKDTSTKSALKELARRKKFLEKLANSGAVDVYSGVQNYKAML